MKKYHEIEHLLSTIYRISDSWTSCVIKLNGPHVAAEALYRHKVDGAAKLT